MKSFSKTEFVKFIVVGGISAALEYGLYFTFKLSLNYHIANILAFALTNIVTYILSKRYVFNATSGKRSTYAFLFFVFLMGALAVNHAVLTCLVDFAHLDDKIAKALAIAVTVIWNFYTRKRYVFKDRTPSKETL
jgi:putative flippase GtrA